MHYPRISVVVPSFNQGEFIEETFKSIFDQNYPNLEVLVVDGGSTDNSIDVIRKYESRISWWVSEKDKGQSDGINKGLRRATGEIITWLNSDDLFMPAILQTIAKHFSTEPDLGLVHGGVITFRDKNESKPDWGYPNVGQERYLAGMAFSQPTAFYRKKYFDLVGGGLREDLHYGMDYDLFARLSTVCRFLPVDGVFAKYRLHSGSKTIAQEEKFIKDWNRVFINLCKNFGWDDVLGELKKIGVFSEPLEYYYKFDFQPEQQLIDRVDKKLLLFYHLCYSLKAYYWTRRIRESRKLAAYLLKNYSLSLVMNEKAVKPILVKIMVPRFIMNTARDLRRSIRKLRQRTKKQ